MSSNNVEKRDGVGAWVVIVILFGLGVWPVALFLLLFKLFGSDKKESKAPPLMGEQSAAPAGKPRKAVRKAMKTPLPKKSRANWMMIIGVVLFGAGVLAFWDPVDMMFFLGGVRSYYLQEALWGLAIAIAGGAMVGSGISMKQQLKRWPRYLSVMGDREAVPVEELARTLGYADRLVEKDLQKMIDKGFFGGKAYLNVELGYLFRSGQAGEKVKRQKEAAAQAAQQPPEEAEAGYSGILRNIRRANDAIADPVLSAKIDRLEAVTAKIFRAVEEDPKKRVRIDTFLNYYLPTTQKLLNSYAEFEAAGVEGENLRQAKSRIESTMDTIVKGFEHQLDELYKADALDVDSDIRVMETMLKRDTASVKDDFGLGGEQ